VQVIVVANNSSSVALQFVFGERSSEPAGPVYASLT
jgi:hypothetical protein